MNLRSKNRISAEFSMSSMTDIIFLLLIFFMLTSNFVTPTALPVNLPSSSKGSIVMQKVSVTITSDLRYFVNEQPSSLENLRTDLGNALGGTEEGMGVVVLNVDKSVPVEYLVKVGSVANDLKAKISIATQTEE
ncbi:biopolymer transporter ExbD [Rufibacter immobilis]|uniref:Biopolymer transporter ExbD n=1 Tax=Rufibacter immobilis TaxID=1348778 RepID=A0A3M9MR66_9BACT|nr:biopolymer transporter ExbD [Rufibacter immobilis]RNI27697.1 biopolymer transporter ExbD [Rufibacter immobilis]